MKYFKDELAVIFIDSFDFLDYKHKDTFINAYIKTGSLKDALFSDDVKECITNERLLEIESFLSKDYIDNLVEVLDKNGVTAITKFSDSYPVSLNTIYSPPHILYAKGNLDLLSSKQILAIVGSRKSLPTSKAIGVNYAKTLTDAGMVIVTGIAEGVEEEILKATYNSGKVISVTAGGLDMVYPKQNAKLFSAVAENGLCLSEQRMGFKPMPYHYPFRNRLIAGLSKGVLVISAGLKSGTMHTVSYALDGGKDIFAIPYNVGVSCGEGCNALIKAGAYLTDKPEDIADFYGLKIINDLPDMTDDERFVYDAIKDAGSIHVDELCEKVNIPTEKLVTKLLMLELKGLIVKNAGNYYSCIKN